MGWARFMGRFVVSLVLGSTGTWASTGCADLKHGSPATPGDPEPSEDGAPDDGATDDGSSPTTRSPGATDERKPQSNEPPGAIIVEELITGRSRLGARSLEGFRPWRSGLAVHDGQLFWVESGTERGIYSAPVTCRASTCVTKITSMTRPASFTATDTAIYTADTNVLKRLAFAPGSTIETVASATADILNVAVDGKDVFWTAGTASAIRWTNSGGTTSTPINANGTPVAMAVAGSKVFWAGVEMSGQLGAVQSMNTNGTGARQVARFSNGFHVMRGDATYLYYATGLPTEIHRLTVATGRDEVVANDALGVTDIALDAKHAYWVEPGDGPDFQNGRVRRVAHDATAPETLAVSVPLPLAVAIAPKRVYVASAGSKPANWDDGKLLQITLP